MADGEGFVRMNIAAPRCVIQEALERMSTLILEKEEDPKSYFNIKIKEE